LGSKSKKATVAEAKDVIDLLVEMRERAEDSWRVELLLIEAEAEDGNWGDLADRLARLLAHVRAGAPFEED